MSEKVKVLWIGDGVTPTGFSTVNHNIIKELSSESFEVHHLAVNYFGDPHKYNHLIYPATVPSNYSFGDLYGQMRIGELSFNNFDFIFILNDIWVIDRYLEEIKRVYTPDKMPKIVVYFPVDGYGYQKSWFKNFDIVTNAVVYTEFGKKTVLDIKPSLESKLSIIPHGTNLKDFFRFEDKLQAKKEIFSPVTDMSLEDSFIVLNANRNQPRKRLDLSIQAFAIFAYGKPTNVRYYHHAGIKDAGWNLFELVDRIDNSFKLAGKYDNGETTLKSRIVITSLEQQVQQVPIEKLNLVYNACDVGINTSLGEGWGLVSTEHAATGAPQIVPDHTACAELFEDCGLLTPIKLTAFDSVTLLDRGFIDVQELAKQLELLYTNKELRESLGQKGQDKFTSEKYQWSYIADQWKELFKEL